MLRTLTRKVTLIALSFLSLFLVAAGFAIASIIIIRDAANHQGENTIEQVELSGYFNTDMFRGFTEALSFARTHTSENRESALQELSDAKVILDQLGHLETEPDPYAPELTPIRIQLQNRRAAVYATIQPKIVDLLRAVDTNDEQAIKQAFDLLNTHKSEVEQLEEDSGTLADSSIAASARAVATRVQTAFVGVATTFGLAVVLIPVVLVLIRRWLVRPITGLAGAAGAVALGKLEQSVPVTNNDEIGDLQRAFNQMAATIQEQTRSLEQQVETANSAREEAEAARTEVADQLAIIEDQRTALREMSVPVLPLSASTLVMPLVGALDTARLRLLREQALRAIEQSSARYLLLDVTGVPLIDTQAAQGLVQVVQAVRLLGAQVVLVGIRPEIAQTMVGLGMQLRDIITRSTLQSGIAYSLAWG